VSARFAPKNRQLSGYNAAIQAFPLLFLFLVRLGIQACVYGPKQERKTNRQRARATAGKHHTPEFMIARAGKHNGNKGRSAQFFKHPSKLQAVISDDHGHRTEKFNQSAG
jgi:cbb3-type cytochrome oxidase subunit 3